MQKGTSQAEATLSSKEKIKPVTLIVIKLCLSDSEGISQAVKLVWAIDLTVILCTEAMVNRHYHR